VQASVVSSHCEFKDSRKQESLVDSSEHRLAW
jgi:hypothetical protein